MSKAITAAAMIGAVAALAALTLVTGGMDVVVALAAMPVLQALLAGGVAMDAGAIAAALTSNRA